MQIGTYEETCQKIEETYREAAKACLPKVPWLTAVSGKYYHKIKDSAFWRKISADWDKLTESTISEKPLVILAKALDIAEQKINEGQPLNSVDISVINIMLNTSRNRAYLKSHLEQRKFNNKIASSEDKRREAESERKQKAFDKLMEADNKDGLIHVLQGEPMTEEQYKLYLTGDSE